MGVTEYPAALHTAVGRTDKRGQETPNGFEMVMFTVITKSLPAPAFETLCDVGQFTVTSGYAKVNVVDVPRRLGLTVFAGYDPLTVTVPLLFDNFGNSDHSADATVERAINLLEWMSGRGESGVAKETPAILGPNTHPPLVELSSSNATETTGLIPHAYRGIEWLITGLAWGDSIRDANGNRQRQRVTVTALQQNDPGIEQAGKKQQGGQWTKYKVTGHKDNTCIELAKNVVKSRKPQKVAKEILDTEKNKALNLRHIKDAIDKDKIKKGKWVWIPVNRE